MDDSFELAPAQWATLRRLLGEALELDAPQRESWLSALAPEHAAYAPRLRRLLAHENDGTAQSPLDTLPKFETGDFAPRPAGPADERVGPYRLLRELGSGGMASVWLAERTDMLQRRQVALKLPHGAWRKAGLVERLAREREILAGLEHPHIARLYDAGVAEGGQPYLALEYVAGERIDDHCRRGALGVPARLRLFVQVARAVAHAHANLVVHRDLKPSNILVTDTGQVKLLDFGVAKLLDPDQAPQSELTQQVGAPMTPSYAAPEQLRGEVVTTAADVYSLGVVLYELLCGQRPAEPGRDEPRPPSQRVEERSRQRTLQGELDTITMKALQPASARRYGTADALAEDVERHLRGESVLALPESRWVRLRRFVRRNRLAVGASAGVLIAMVLGSGLALWQAGRAAQEQRRAEEVRDFIASVFRDADPWEAEGRVLSAAELLSQADKRIDQQQLASAAVRVELRTLVAAGLSGLQQMEAAERAIQRAVADARQHLQPEHPLALAARARLTSVQRFRGQTAEAARELDTLIPALQASGRPADLQLALNNRAHVAIDGGRYEEAVAAAREALASAERVHATDPAELAATVQLLAVALRFARQPDEALRHAERSMELALRGHADNPRHLFVVSVRMGLANVLADTGQMRRGLVEMRRAHEDHEALRGRDGALGYYAANIALVEADLGEGQSALAHAEQAVALVGKELAPDSVNQHVVRTRRSTAHLALRDGERALQDLRPAAPAIAKAFGAQHSRTVEVNAALTLALAYAGQADAAQRAARALAAAQPAGALHPRVAHAVLTAHRVAGSPAEALPWAERVRDTTALEPKQRPAWARALTAAALTFIDNQRAAEGRPLLERAAALQAQAEVAPSPDTAEVQAALLRLAPALRNPRS